MHSIALMPPPPPIQRLHRNDVTRDTCVWRMRKASTRVCCLPTSSQSVRLDVTITTSTRTGETKIQSVDRENRAPVRAARCVAVQTRLRPPTLSLSRSLSLFSQIDIGCGWKHDNSGEASLRRALSDAPRPRSLATPIGWREEGKRRGSRVRSPAALSLPLSHSLRK